MDSKMKAYAIVIEDNEISEAGYAKLVKSSWDVKNEFTLDRFNAIIPSNVLELMESSRIRWNYPWEGQVVDFQTGMTKTAYKTNDYRKRMACSMSHYALWVKSFETGENILVLEHDAEFTSKLDIDIDKTLFGVLGVNSPLGATRKSQVYHDMIQKNPNQYQEVPYIDDIKIPQGLAGNSSYIVTPWAAKEMIDKVHEYGLWPNDAIMCRQIFSFLGVTKKYYTKTQGLESTTTL